MDRRKTLQTIGNASAALFIGSGIAAAAKNPPRTEIPLKRLDDLREIAKIQQQEGNWDFDPYMLGLANGLILALAIIEDSDPKFLNAPDSWRSGSETISAPACALNRLSRAMQSDPEYAWSWHCNIATAAIDQGLSPAAANRAAADFMMRAFSVNTSRA